MIRLAVVGTSHITDLLLGGARLTGRYTLTAVVSRDPARGRALLDRHSSLAARDACVYPSVEALCQGGAADAVYIASPNGLHPSQARLCLERGLHVLCEKPIVTHAEEFVSLCSLARERGLVYMEAIIPPHTPGRQKLLDAIALLGPLRTVVLDYSQYSSRLESYLAGTPANVFDMSMHGGSLMDLGVYCVWGAIDLLGVPDAVRDASATYLPGGADGAGNAVLSYPTFDCRLSYCKTKQGMLGSRFVGENGTLTVSMISLYSGAILSLKSGETREILGSPSREELMAGEATSFADYIEHPAETAAAYGRITEATLAVHRVMDQIKAKAGIVYPARKQ